MNTEGAVPGGNAIVVRSRLFTSKWFEVKNAWIFTPTSTCELMAFTGKNLLYFTYTSMLYNKQCFGSY
jgi:hypothetical protein